jgi:SEC-C motif-containing protein
MAESADTEPPTPDAPITERSHNGEVADSLTTRCPCLSGDRYDDCCGRLHRREADAATAERLMRSRYSAFVVGDAGYLLQTWHPRTRPKMLELDPGVRWYRLDILRTARGGLLDADGTVEFRAFYREDSGAGQQHELSRFQRDGGRWRYLDGESV